MCSVTEPKDARWGVGAIDLSSQRPTADGFQALWSDLRKKNCLIEILNPRVFSLCPHGLPLVLVRAKETRGRALTFSHSLHVENINYGRQTGGIRRSFVLV